MTRPVALTIAGSDSGGGAGIQADLKTFHQFGVFGTTVLTAVTAQNTQGVSQVEALSPQLVRAQLDAIAEDLRPVAVKTGMLANALLIETVLEGLEQWSLTPVVVDPVMVATSGDRLLDVSGEDRMRDLLRTAALVTPNTPEAQVLTGIEIQNVDAAARAARALVDLGAGAALVKGGHLGTDSDDRVTDVLWDGAREQRWSHPRIRTLHTHGTGCTLSAATAAGLAHGRDLAEAVEAALAFVNTAIRRAPGLGSGRGPVDHFAPPPSWATDLY